jgi:shikimate kinase
LYGLSGTYKKTVGKLLADRLGMLYCDTDRLIEYTVDCTIAEYLDHYTAEAFSRLERKVILQASEYDDVVIAANAATLDNPENAANLSKSGVMIWLKAKPEVIACRLEDEGDRPGAPRGDRLAELKELLAAREPIFKKAAEITVDNTLLSPEETAVKIMKELLKYTRRQASEVCG